MSPSPPFESLPNALLDTLVSHILETCPSLIVTLLSAFGTRVHASAIRVLFTHLTIPDDARYFLASKNSVLELRHPISAIFNNSDRYARAVKRLSITDIGLPTTSAGPDALGSLGLVTIEEEDADADDGDGQTRVAFEPMPTESLTALLKVCSNLEEFVWSSGNPPPDGVCETLSEQNPRLINFTSKPNAPFKITAGAPLGVQSAVIRSAAPKWDAPSLPLLAVLPLTRLHIMQLSQQGSRALVGLFSHFGEYSLLEDVCLNFVWLDDPLCEKLVEAGRRIKRLKIGTSGTKLTDKGIVYLFEGCDSLEEFSLIEAQGRLSRNLWSKLSTLPANFHKFKLAISERGPHHSWTADHLLSFSSLQLNSLSHLSVIRIVQPPHFSKSNDILEHDPHIDDVAILKGIPKDVVAIIRDAASLTVLECDWWAWKPDDVKALLERCTQLEYLKLAFDAPFTKLLTLTSTFTPMIKLLKLSVSIPAQHAPGPNPAPVPASPQLGMSPTHPLTPAASPVRRRSSLPSTDSECPQNPCTDDLKSSGLVDPSLPLLREVKRFVKKCPRLVELEWYGRNARGKWFISRSVTTSKINTNVTVEHHPPVVSPGVWKRASREKAFSETISSCGCVFQTMKRQGQAWTGLKAQQVFAERLAEKEREDTLASEKPGRSNGVNKRSSTTLASISSSISGTVSVDKQAQINHSPVQPFTPLSPPTSTKSFATTQEHVSVDPSRAADQSVYSPRRTPSEPSLRTNGANGRARSSTTSGNGAHRGSGTTTGRGRNGYPAVGHGAHRDGRGRGSGKSSSGGGTKRNSTSGRSEGAARGGGGGRGHGTGRGNKRKTSTTAH